MSNNGAEREAALIVVGVVLTAIGGGLGALLKWNNKAVAVLGDELVGKTTLLSFMKDGELPESPTRTMDPSDWGKFRLKRASGAKVRVLVPAKRWNVKQDVPGDHYQHWRDWEKAFQNADIVLYLFRADSVAGKRRPASTRVRDQLDALANWTDRFPAPNRKVILVGTWADADPTYATDPEDVIKRVRSNHALDTARKKLRAKVVVGSLATRDEAVALVKKMVNAL